MSMACFHHHPNPRIPESGFARHINAWDVLTHLLHGPKELQELFSFQDTSESSNRPDNPSLTGDFPYITRGILGLWLLSTSKQEVPPEQRNNDTWLWYTSHPRDRCHPHQGFQHCGHQLNLGLRNPGAEGAAELVDMGKSPSYIGCL